MVYLAVTLFNYLILQYITVAMIYLAVTLFNYLILQYTTVAMIYLAVTLFNKMNCELMVTYDTPALRQTGNRNLMGPKTLPTI
jgi:hypothetical protein